MDYKKMYFTLFGDVSSAIDLLAAYQFDQNPSKLAFAIDQSLTKLRKAQVRAEDAYLDAADPE